MYKHKPNTVSESAPVGTTIGTCRVHPQKKYAINDHDPDVLGCDERTGEVYVSNAGNIVTAVQQYGILAQGLVDDVVVSTQAISIANESYATAVPVIDGLPLIVGVAKEGEMLTVIAAEVSGVPVPTVSLQLQFNGVDYGAPMTGTTFVPQLTDVGGTFTVIQTATNSQGSDSATSAATATVVVGDSVPVIDGVPTISGAAQVDQVLTATPASVTSSPASTLTWKWYADAVEIGGATASTYTPIVGQIGEVITAEQIETNSEGSDTALSAATTAVIAATPYTASPVITSNGGGATAAFSVNENIAAATTVTATPAYDVVYTISGGADSAFFSIDEVTGALAFLSAPTFGSLADGDGNDVYEVEVTATAADQSDTQAISVTVTEQAGPTLGPELWPIPDFQSAAGLSSSGAGTWTVSGGTATCNGGAASMSIYNVTTVGVTYRHEITVATRTAGSCRWGWTGGTIELADSAGTFTIDKVAEGTGVHIGSAGFQGTVTAYSCKEVL